jgi:hypothetical protein
MKKTKKVGIVLIVCGLLSTVGAAFTYVFRQTILVPYSGSAGTLDAKLPELTNPIEITLFR